MMVGQYNAFSGKCERGPRGVMAVLLMVVNALLVSVLMVNMLIAMMGSPRSPEQQVPYWGWPGSIAYPSEDGGGPSPTTSITLISCNEATPS